jgi:hypothetical protein
MVGSKECFSPSAPSCGSPAYIEISANRKGSGREGRIGSAKVRRNNSAGQDILIRSRRSPKILSDFGLYRRYVLEMLGRVYGFETKVRERGLNAVEAPAEMSQVIGDLLDHT